MSPSKCLCRCWERGPGEDPQFLGSFPHLGAVGAGWGPVFCWVSDQVLRSLRGIQTAFSGAGMMALSLWRCHPGASSVRLAEELQRLGGPQPQASPLHPSTPMLGKALCASARVQGTAVAPTSGKGAEEREEQKINCLTFLSLSFELLDLKTGFLWNTSFTTYCLLIDWLVLCAGRALFNKRKYSKIERWKSGHWKNKAGGGILSPTPILVKTNQKLRRISSHLQLSAPGPYQLRATRQLSS